MSRDRDDKPEERGGDFLGRWSRMKRSAGTEPAPPKEPEAEAAPPPHAEPAKTDAELLEELGLPDPESLVPGDDFSVFMARTVPARLRNRALRRLWVSNPVLANLDGLNDYDEDFTDAAVVVAGMKTAYQVGRGFVEELAGDPEADGQAETGAAGETTAGPDAPGGTFAGTEPVADDEDGGGESRPEVADDGSAADRTAAVKPVRRRMRFRLVED